MGQPEVGLPSMEKSKQVTYGLGGLGVLLGGVGVFLMSERGRVILRSLRSRSRTPEPESIPLCGDVDAGYRPPISQRHTTEQM